MSTHVLLSLLNKLQKRIKCLASDLIILTHHVHVISPPDAKSCDNINNDSWFQVARSKDALNSGDVFILDHGNNLYLWMGKDCNKDEKFSVCINTYK